MLLFLTWSLIACDDGKIYDETVIVTGEGRTLKLTGQITGVESWPEEYSVVVAGFGDGEFAVASKSVPASAADGEELEVTLSGGRRIVLEMDKSAHGGGVQELLKTSC